jgi:nucleotide-binding universal stress UspA family protein
MTYRRIVVAIDESDAATHAVREGVALACLTGAELLFVHVGAFPRSEEALARAEGVATRAEVKRTTARVAIDGGVGPTILREARRWAADLIVVGSHGRRGIERMLLGSVAEAVARAADVPVLLVRAAR